MLEDLRIRPLHSEFRRTERHIDIAIHDTRTLAANVLAPMVVTRSMVMSRLSLASRRKHIVALARLGENSI